MREPASPAAMRDAVGMVCSFSIPIITIVALILLIIFVKLLDIIFFWMPFFQICLPLPNFSAKETHEYGRRTTLRTRHGVSTARWDRRAHRLVRKARPTFARRSRSFCKTEQRERINLPDFGAGLRPFLFEPNTVATRFQIEDRITKALQLWEPRISVTRVEVEEDPPTTQAAIATIQYQLVATQAHGSVTST